MERQIIVKDLSLMPLDVSENGIVKVAFNRVNYKDFDGDVIVPEAYTKTISERGAKGKDLIYHLTDHTWKWSSSFIGKPKELFIENDYLVGVTEIDTKTNTHGAFMHARYINKEVNQHSIGCRVIRATQKNDHNEITEVMLLEGSAVLWGANIDTPTLSAKSFQNNTEIITELEELEKDFKKYLKTGLSVEDTLFFGNRIEQLYQSLKTITKPSNDTLPKSVKDEIDNWLFI
jgi:uncharacterized protein